MNLTYRSALCHSVGPSIVSSVRPSVRLLSNLCTRYFETDFDADWHKWSTGQGREWNDQGVKDQGHMTPKYVEKIHFDLQKNSTNFNNTWHAHITVGSGHFPWTYASGYFPPPEQFYPLLLGVAHFPLYHHCPLSYNIKRSTVKVYKIERGRGQECGLVPVFKLLL